MPLEIPTYDVLLAAPTEEDPDATIEHRTRILNGDQLRAELEGPKHGLTNVGEAPLHFQSLWVWASLTRQHLIEDPWPEFKRRLLTYKKAEAAPADPTQLAADTD